MPSRDRRPKPDYVREVVIQAAFPPDLFNSTNSCPDVSVPRFFNMGFPGPRPFIPENRIYINPLQDFDDDADGHGPQ